MEHLEERSLLSVTTELLAVLDTMGSSEDSSLANLTAAGNTLFFTGRSNTAGSELWKSDGTAGGTVMLQDIYVGIESSSPHSLTEVNGTLFFVADDGAYGEELWKSDGTKAGTVLVKDIRVGREGSSPSWLTNVNGVLFFVADNRLWKSDGTSTGTVMVGVRSGISYPSQLTNVNGVLYFAAIADGSGRELWTSDGTEPGTVLVADIRPGSSADSSPTQLIDVNGTLYFLAYNGSRAWGFEEVWKSDGTAAGTVLVWDFPGSLERAIPRDLTNVGGTLFFTAEDGIHGRELWKSDGTPAGTLMLKDIQGGMAGSDPKRLTEVNGQLYFTADDGDHGNEVWKSDGTQGGTGMMADLGPSPAGADHLTDVGGVLYFYATGVAGAGLWKSDGTATGTLLVESGSVPWGGENRGGPITSCRGVTYFADGVASDRFDLWKTDGTREGTKLVKVLSISQPFTHPSTPTRVNRSAYFTAYDQVHGAELWTSDGTVSGTRLVKDIEPGNWSSAPRDLVNVNGTLYFVAANKLGRRYLWRLDDATDDPQLVTDFGATDYDPSPAQLTNVNGTLYLTAQGAFSGEELWKSDGTAAGTVLVLDIRPNGHSSPRGLTSLNGNLYFTVDDGAHGVELWKSNGTAAGTVLVRDICPGACSSNPGEPTLAGGKIYFRADDGTHGAELWKTDGTAAGTTLTRDLRGGSESSAPQSLTDLNGKVYFFATADGTVGEAWWRSDGTTSGTVPVGMPDGWSRFSPRYYTKVNGLLLFAAWDDQHGFELWKSDGTAAGTVLVRDIWPGIANSYPANLTNVNGTLYFRANDGRNGEELWRSDGTVAGTVMVEDVAPAGGAFPQALTAVDGWLLFSVTSDDRGAQLRRTVGTSGNGAPTVSLANTVSTWLESAPVPAKVGDIMVADDGLGQNVLSLSGSDAALFNIVGGALYLTTAPDYESAPVVNVVVEVDDPTVGGAADGVAGLSISVHDADDPPRVDLFPLFTTLPENACGDTQWLKVADVVVTDDDLGSATLSLSGPDASLFALASGGLSVVCWPTSRLDFESNPVLDVTVTVDDPALGTTPDDKADWSLPVADANDPPRVQLRPANGPLYLPENTVFTSRLTIGEIVVVDDALGTNIVTLSEDDAEFFEIVDGVLYLKAGVVLDYETRSWLEPAVLVDDPTVGTKPDSRSSETIFVSDRNDPPTAVDFANAVATLREDAAKSARAKVADVIVTDDALGVNGLSLAGSDAALFEIDGGKLYVRAGAALDFETHPLLEATVVANDIAVGATPDAVASFTLSLTDVNERPRIALAKLTTVLPESTDTTSRVPVAEIVITDDALGSNQLLLGGIDGSQFDIADGWLYLEAGAVLDHETSPQLNVTVIVDDTTVGTTPDGTASLAITVENVVPTARIQQAAAQPDPTAIPSIWYEVFFSEPVSGFDAQDVVLSGAVQSGGVAVWATGNGTTFTVNVTGMKAYGTVIASIPAGAAYDGAGAGNAASTASDNAVLFVAPAWHNFSDPFDVTGDGEVTPQDVLTIVNYINRQLGSSFPQPPSIPPPYYDVDEDGSCTPSDVLAVINKINNRSGAGEGEVAGSARLWGAIESAPLQHPMVRRFVSQRTQADASSSASDFALNRKKGQGPQGGTFHLQPLLNLFQFACLLQATESRHDGIE